MAVETHEEWLKRFRKPEVGDTVCSDHIPRSNPWRRMGLVVSVEESRVLVSSGYTQRWASMDGIYVFLSVAEKAQIQRELEECRLRIHSKP